MIFVYFVLASALHVFNSLGSTLTNEGLIEAVHDRHRSYFEKQHLIKDYLNHDSILQKESEDLVAKIPIEKTHPKSKQKTKPAIVMFKKEIPAWLINMHVDWLNERLEEHESELKFQFSELKGFSGSFSQDLIDYFYSHPDIMSVEDDQPVYALDVQTHAPWGLARLSHKDHLNLQNYNVYCYDEEGGLNVVVYVLDTGIFRDHPTFENRILDLVSFVGTENLDDGNGHGTHVAGIIGSKDYGVAKKAELFAVKVLGAGGGSSTSSVIAGIDFVIEQHKKHNKTSVINMSLGGPPSASLDLAIQIAAENNIHVVVAAGNENQDACNVSPARSEFAITVGATTISDSKAEYSNYGNCVDIYGPGSDILSSWNTGGSLRLSGTSMASPHLAGLSAYLLSTSNSSMTPEKLKSELRKLGNKNTIKGGRTEDVLAFNAYPQCDFKSKL